MSSSHYFNPYKSMVFWPLWILFIVMAIILSAVVYWFFAQQVFHKTQTELQQIAVKTASFIPVEIHERLQKPEDQNSEDYELIELYFQSIMTGNPKISDIYTLRPAGEPHQMTFVVSGMETEDTNQNGLIEEFEIKPALGEKYDTSPFPELELGLNKPSFDKKITYDKWGAWLSGYAPLKNKQGKTVALVGIDFAADTIAKDRQVILKLFLFIDAILIIPLALLAYYISNRISRPYRLLGKAIDEVRRGDFNYRLNIKKKSLEYIIANQFNDLAEVYSALVEKKLKERKEKE